MENGNVAEIFGEKVFNLPTMKARLPKDIYKSLLKLRKLLQMQRRTGHLKTVVLTTLTGSSQ